jgi:hypothetical protein
MPMKQKSPRRTITISDSTKRILDRLCRQKSRQYKFRFSQRLMAELAIRMLDAEWRTK